jgi:3-hydroxymyristoyl/3-hydroxydecanoyl-(acyl carrier protein) dehydratase
MTRIAFEFRVPATHPALAGHFPGNPVVPGVLMLDHVMQALEQVTGLAVTRLTAVKFVSTLLPEELAQGEWTVDGAQARFRLVSQRNGCEMKVAEGSATVSAGLAP